MDHYRRLGDRISISIPSDENSFTGRECPQSDREGYSSKRKRRQTLQVDYNTSHYAVFLPKKTDLCFPI